MTEMKPQGPWNSLEVAKLLASMLTAVAVAVLGYVLTQQTHRLDERNAQRVRIEAQQSAREAAIAEKRVQLWDELGPRLSRLNLAFNSVHEFPARPDGGQVRATAEEAENLLSAHQIYFPQSFNEEVWNYLNGVEAAMTSFENHQMENEDYATLRANYDRVLDAARSALGVSRGARAPAGQTKAGVP